MKNLTEIVEELFESDKHRDLTYRLQEKYWSDSSLDDKIDFIHLLETKVAELSNRRPLVIVSLEDNSRGSIIFENNQLKINMLDLEHYPNPFVFVKDYFKEFKILEQQNALRTYNREETLSNIEYKAVQNNLNRSPLTENLNALIDGNDKLFLHQPVQNIPQLFGYEAAFKAVNKTYDDYGLTQQINEFYAREWSVYQTLNDGEKRLAAIKRINSVNKEIKEEMSDLFDIAMSSASHVNIVTDFVLYASVSPAVSLVTRPLINEAVIEKVSYMELKKYGIDLSNGFDISHVLYNGKLNSALSIVETVTKNLMQNLDKVNNKMSQEQIQALKNIQTQPKDDKYSLSFNENLNAESQLRKQIFTEVKEKSIDAIKRFNGNPAIMDSFNNIENHMFNDNYTRIVEDYYKMNLEEYENKLNEATSKNEFYVSPKQTKLTNEKLHSQLKEVIDEFYPLGKFDRNKYDGVQFLTEIDKVISDYYSVDTLAIKTSFERESKINQNNNFRHDPQLRSFNEPRDRDKNTVYINEQVVNNWALNLQSYLIQKRVHLTKLYKEGKISNEVLDLTKEQAGLISKNFNPGYYVSSPRKTNVAQPIMNDAFTWGVDMASDLVRSVELENKDDRFVKSYLNNLGSYYKQYPKQSRDEVNLEVAKIWKEKEVRNNLYDKHKNNLKNITNLSSNELGQYFNFHTWNMFSLEDKLAVTRELDKREALLEKRKTIKQENLERFLVFANNFEAPEFVEAYYKVAYMEKIRDGIGPEFNYEDPVFKMINTIGNVNDSVPLQQKLDPFYQYYSEYMDRKLNNIKNESIKVNEIIGHNLEEDFWNFVVKKYDYKSIEKEITNLFNRKLDQNKGSRSEGDKR